MASVAHNWKQMIFADEKLQVDYAGTLSWKRISVAEPHRVVDPVKYSAVQYRNKSRLQLAIDNYVWNGCGYSSTYDWITWCHTNFIRECWQRISDMIQQIVAAKDRDTEARYLNEVLLWAIRIYFMRYR